MAKSVVTLLALAAAFLGVPAMGQAPADSHPDFKASIIGSALTCSSPDKQPEEVHRPSTFRKASKTQGTTSESIARKPL